MSKLHYNSVDIIYLENESNICVFKDNIEKLQSNFIEIQISKNFNNIELYKTIYNLFDNTDKCILLNIPHTCDIKDLNIKKTDALMIRYEVNKDNLSEILEYCVDNNIRHFLRVSNTEDIKSILKYRVQYPSLMIVLRMENIDFIQAYNMLGNSALYLDMPVCLLKKYDLKSSLKAINDVEAFLDDSGYYKADVNNFLLSYNKSKKHCINCSNNKLCFGFLKDNPSIKDLIYSTDIETKYEYTPVADRVLNNKAVDLKVIKFNPRNIYMSGSIGVNAINQMQKTRLEKKFSGRNFYYIWDFSESCYFNRPLTEEPLFKLDTRGLMSLNWRFIGVDNPDMLWKQKCDLLLPQHGFTITSQITFDKHWAEDFQNTLDNLTLDTICDIIIDYGGDRDKLKKEGNDLLYNGKKFCGKEWLLVNNVGYIENTVVTCEYKPEEKWFKLLYHHKNEYQITGITEEVPNCTKNVLLKELRLRGIKFFKGF